MIDFPKKLKNLRELQGWSQEELAKRLGVSRSKIGNYEQGIREPGFEDLEAIADIFNCPISYLIEDTEVDPGYYALIQKINDDEETKDFIELYLEAEKRDRYAAYLFLKALVNKINPKP